MKKAITLTITLLAILAIIIVPLIVEGGEYYIKFLIITWGLYVFVLCAWFFINNMIKIWKPMYEDWRKKHDKK